MLSEVAAPDRPTYLFLIQKVGAHNKHKQSRPPAPPARSTYHSPNRTEQDLSRKIQPTVKDAAADCCDEPIGPLHTITKPLQTNLHIKKGLPPTLGGFGLIEFRKTKTNIPHTPNPRLIFKCYLGSGGGSGGIPLESGLGSRLGGPNRIRPRIEGNPPRIPPGHPCRSERPPGRSMANARHPFKVKFCSF